MTPEADLNVLKSCAGAANNAAWDMIEDPQSDARGLLTLAAAAREMWGRIGTPYQIAHADLLLGWAAARAGASETALACVGAAMEVLTGPEASAFDKAIAHSGMAAACHAAGDLAGFAEHRAQALAIELPDGERRYFEAPFKTLPGA